jgi:Nucleotidyltransferase domain
MDLPPNVERAIDGCLERLRRALGGNLHACLLYGSGARGDLNPGISDINLLIVLRESTPQAHIAIAEAIRGPQRIEPFVLGLPGLKRSFRAFAVKFRSIQRNHRLLHGEDPLAGLTVDERTIRLECEQTVRNLRLRAVHAFVTLPYERYGQYLLNATADVFAALSEILRVDGVVLPADRVARLPLLASEYDADVSALRDLLERKRRPRRFSGTDAADLHARLLGLLDEAIARVERRWPE